MKSFNMFEVAISNNSEVDNLFSAYQRNNKTAVPSIYFSIYSIVLTEVLQSQ